MASYEETLVNITLDAHEDLAINTQNPYGDREIPEGASHAAGFQYRFVFVSGPHQCNLYTGDGTPVGVLQNKPQVTEHAATVAVDGISLVEAAGEIDPGAGVGADGQGRATAGGDLGIAIHGATEAGQIIPVLLRLSAPTAAA